MIASSSLTSPAAPSTQAHSSEKGSLIIDVQSLSKQTSSLNKQIKKLSKLGIDNNFLQKLLPPELLITSTLSKDHLRKRKLTPKSRLFSPLRKLIREIELMQHSLKKTAPLLSIKKIYQDFIQEVCQNKGWKREKLLIGQAYLEGHNLGRISIRQSLARSLVSIDSYGQPVKTTLLGSNAIQKIGEAYYNSIWHEPLSLVEGFIFNSFISLITDQTIVPTLLLKVQNIWIKEVLCDKNQGNPLQRQLQVEFSKGESSIGDIFERHPELKANYPFEKKRVTHFVHASKGVDGKNLHDHLVNENTIAINPTSFTLQFIFALLFRMSDAQANNYILNQEGSLILRYTGSLFLSPYKVNKATGQHAISLRTILFLLPHMNDPLDSRAVDIFLNSTTNIDHLLIEWLMGIQNKNAEYSVFLKSGLLTQKDFTGFNLPISLSYASFRWLETEIRALREILIEPASSTLSFTHWDLFSFFYPVLSKVYQRLSEGGVPLAQQRLLFSTDPLTVEELLENTSHSLEEIELEQLRTDTPVPLPTLLELWLKNPPTLSVEEQRLFLERILSFNALKTLPLYNSQLEDLDLKYFIDRFNIETVILDHCPYISAQTLIDIASKHPTLKITLGRLPHFTSNDFAEIISFFRERGKSCHFMIDNTSHEVTEKNPHELILKLLLARDFAKVEGLAKTGLPCNPDLLGDEFLHKLAEYDAPESIAFLLHQGFPSNLKNHCNQIPLHLAAQAGWTNNLLPLLGFSDAVNARDSEGRTPLHLAVIQGKEEVVARLLELNADPFAVTDIYENIFHLAAFYGHASILRMLLRPEFIQMIHHTDRDGNTPLQHAVWMDPKPEIVRLLLEAGATVDQTNNYSYTPLHWAAIHGHVKSAILLLNRNADFTLVNIDGKTPIDMAINSGQDAITRLFLLPNGAPIPEEDVEFFGSSSKDPEGDYYNAFERAYEAGNPVNQILYLEKLAGISLEKGDIMRTAHLINGALAVAQKNPIHPRYQEHLFSRLEELEEIYLGKLFGLITPSSHYNCIERHRYTLQTLRRDVKIKLANKVQVEDILLFISKGYENLLSTLIEECIELIGHPPTEFAVMSLGSLARKEACPFSDVEFVILVANETDETMTYFRNLTRLLELKVTNLGETKWNIIRPKRIDDHMRDAASLTPSGFSMDIGGLSPLGKQGVYELIGTPKKIAAFQDSAWIEKHEGELILVNALTIVSKVYGEESLFKMYKKLIQKSLSGQKGKSRFTFKRNRLHSKEYEKRALHLLKGHVEEFKPFLQDERIEIRAFDIKKDFYRPIQMAINGLMLYNGFLSATNCIQSISELTIDTPSLKFRKDISAGFLSHGAKNLRQALRMIYKLRIEAHIFNQNEDEILCIDSRTEHPKDYFQPSDSLSLIRELYCVLIPFHKAMQYFCSYYSIPPSAFFDDSIGKITLDHEEKYEFSQAESSYVQATALNPDDPDALAYLSRIRNQMGKVEDALKYQYERLNTLQRLFRDEPKPELAITYNNIAVIEANLGNLKTPCKLIDYLEKALKIQQLLYGDSPHEDVAMTKRNLGWLLILTGKAKEGIPHALEALSLYTLIYPDKRHKDIAKTLNVIGLGYNILEDGKTALSYFNDALELLNAIFSEKLSLEKINTMNGLGGAYLLLNDNSLATTSLQEAYKMEREIYGPMPHPDILVTLNRLAETKKNEQHYSEAIELYEQVLLMTKQLDSSWKQSIPVLRIMLNLANAHLKLFHQNCSLTHQQRALALYDQICLSDRIKSYFGRSSDNSSAKYWLESIDELVNTNYAGFPNLDQAIQRLRNDWQRTQPIIESNPHPRFIRFILQMGKLHNKIDLEKNSIIYYKIALKMCRYFNNTSGSELRREALLYLGDSYKKIGKFEKAITSYEEANHINQELYNEPDGSLEFEIAKMHCNMAYSKENEGLVSKSLEHFDKFTRLCLDYLGTITNSEFRELASIAGHDFKAFSGNSLHLGIDVGVNEKKEAANYVKQGRYVDAISHYQKALSLYQALYKGEPHPREASMIRWIGYYLKKINSIPSVVEHYEQALMIDKQFFQQNEEFLEEYKSNLRNTIEHFQEIGETEKAKKYTDELSQIEIKAVDG